MSHIFRFHATRLEPMQWSLSSEEWHHLLKVVRLEVGHALELGDGHGWMAVGRLEQAGKQTGQLKIEHESFTAPRPRERSVVLAIAALKPQSIDELIPPLIELGLDHLVIFPFQGMAKSRLLDKVRERWERIVAAAAKQCKRAWWPEVRWIESFDEFLVYTADFSHRLLLDPDAPHLLADWLPDPPGSVITVIGSEKGLSFEEQKLLQARDFQGMRVEGSILRAVTASLAATTLLRHNPRLRDL